jgi:GNAT superfamily N-acetyltransferase
MLEMVTITDDTGAIIAPDWLARPEIVHRQLRDRLPRDYAGKMARVFVGGGRMVVAVVDGVVRGVAVYRIYENTFSGVQLYVDDLVTDPAQRSTGVGHALMEWLAGKGRAHGCKVCSLDSGTQRQQAHEFCFREGMVVTSFHFDKALA